MFWKKASLALLTFLAVSLFINIILLSGCPGDDRLLREKDALVLEFGKQIKDLEEKNNRFKASLAQLEERLAAYSEANAWAKEELEKIMNEYRLLKQE